MRCDTGVSVQQGCVANKSVVVKVKYAMDEDNINISGIRGKGDAEERI